MVQYLFFAHVDAASLDEMNPKRFCQAYGLTEPGPAGAAAAQTGPGPARE
jgi:hypothetical protein